MIKRYAHPKSSPSSSRRGVKQQPSTSTGPLPSQPPLYPQLSYSTHPDDLLLAPQPDITSPPSRKRKAPGMSTMAGMQQMHPPGLGDPGGLGESMEPLPETASPMPAPKKSRTNTPWTPAEEQRLKTMRDAQNSWGEIAKVGKDTVEWECRISDCDPIQRHFPTGPKEVSRSIGTRWVPQPEQSWPKHRETEHVTGYALRRICRG